MPLCVAMSVNDVQVQEEIPLPVKPLQLSQIVAKDYVKDRWLAEDKFQHFFVSAFLTGVGYLIMREPLETSENRSVYYGSGFSFSLGVGKEISDSRNKKNHACFKDLVANMLGIGFTVLLIKTL